jgi:hypothetical protein
MGEVYIMHGGHDKFTNILAGKSEGNVPINMGG